MSFINFEHLAPYPADNMTEPNRPLRGCLTILVAGIFGLLAILSLFVGPPDQRHGYAFLFWIAVIVGGIWTFFPVMDGGDKVLSEADRLTISAERIKENSDNRDTLTGAAWNGDWSKVKLLLEGGADVNQANSKEQTALDLARARGDKQLINLLLSHGATQFCAKKSDDEMHELG